MRKYFASQSGLFNPRVLLAFALCSVGVLLAMLGFAGTPSSGTKELAGANANVAVTASASAPLGPTTNLSNGITFDHAILNDPVRMISEPDIVIDNAGGIYVSGPWGTPTQTSWFWKSDDKGVNWHSIGVLPEKSNGQNGGGDTEITTSKDRNVFTSDLQTLICNSVQRSLDEGKTFTTGEGCFPGTDRQWMGVYDPTGTPTNRRIYLGANYAALNGCYILVSTDNGITYAPPNPTINPTANIGSGCIGRFAVDPNNGQIFVPTDGGTTTVSTDGGLTWSARGSSGAQGNFFAPIFLDSAANLYQAWVDNPDLPANHAYISASTDRGFTWTTKQVSTGPASPIGTSPDLRQNVFPWGVAGDPGRVAVVWYGTTDTQKDTSVPAYGGPNANWHAYATFSTDLVNCNPTCTVNPSAHFTQVQADEHPMHRAAICLGGFPNCLEANSDRSMADFFMVDKDPQGRVYIAYNENSDLSLVVPQPAEYIGKPLDAVIRLRTGPSLFAAQGNLLPLPTPANVAINSASLSGGTLSVAGTHGLPPGNWTTDPAGDAIFPVVPTAGPNFTAMDILEASVSDDGTNLTAKMKLADLSSAAIATAASLQPTWMVTWWQGKSGIGPTNMTPPYHSHWFAKWLGQNNFVFGRASSINHAALGAPTPKLMDYNSGTTTTTGTVSGNVVTITVPLASLGLTSGDKIDHIHAYALSEHGGGEPEFPVDTAKSFSYLIGTPAARQHFPDGYVEVSLDNFATSTLATLNSANNTWTASIPSSTGGTVCARQVLAKDLYTPLWDDVQAGPVACSNFGPPIPTSVVSRKVHGGAGTFDITLPLTGTRGVECRTTGQTGTAGFDYKVVFTFPTPITGCGTANTGTVVSGPNSNQCTVNLTGLSNAQYTTVTLTGVTNATGSGNASGTMGLLVGDTTADGSVNSADIGQTKSQSGHTVTISNFREDVTVDGSINSADIGLVKSKSGTALPSLP